MRTLIVTPVSLSALEIWWPLWYVPNMTLTWSADWPLRIHYAIWAGSVVTGPFTSDALTLLLFSVGSVAVFLDISFLGSYPAVSSEHTASVRISFSACCRYTRLIWATNAIEGHKSMDRCPPGVSPSTMRREILVLPVPHSRMICLELAPLAGHRFRTVHARAKFGCFP